MGDWQTMDTLRKDETRFLVTNGEIFAGACWEIDYSEPAMLRRTVRCISCPHPHFIDEEYPNPKAGQAVYTLRIGNPIGFDDKFEPRPGYDESFDEWEPTHWRPMISPPEVLAQAAE